MGLQASRQIKSPAIRQINRYIKQRNIETDIEGIKKRRRKRRRVRGLETKSGEEEGKRGVQECLLFVKSAGKEETRGIFWSGEGKIEMAEEGKGSKRRRKGGLKPEIEHGKCCKNWNIERAQWKIILYFKKLIIDKKRGISRKKEKK